MARLPTWYLPVCIGLRAREGQASILDEKNQSASVEFIDRQAGGMDGAWWFDLGRPWWKLILFFLCE